MKFKTLRTSETGLKFQKIADKMDEISIKTKALIEEIGAEQWRPSRWAVHGGIECVLFAPGVIPDPKTWKKKDGGHAPRKNTIQGKAISIKIDSLPVLSRRELNMCIGLDEIFRSIGFSRRNSEYFTFSVGDEWNCKIPSDCIEITHGEWLTLQ